MWTVTPKGENRKNSYSELASCGHHLGTPQVEERSILTLWIVSKHSCTLSLTVWTVTPKGEKWKKSYSELASCGHHLGTPQVEERSIQTLWIVSKQSCTLSLTVWTATPKGEKWKIVTAIVLVRRASGHSLSQQGVFWVSFWTPKPLKSIPKDTQSF